jgi:SAM-dependent methyltransferase
VYTDTPRVARHDLPARMLRVLDRWLRSGETRPKTPEEQTSHEVRKASASMGRYLDQLPRRDVDVLDYGCGWGGETLWLAPRVRSVVGVDVDEASLDQARRACAGSAVRNCRFVSSDNGRIPLPDASVDAVFSTDTFEHVMDLDVAFAEIARVLRPSGLLVTQFGPLFYSPYGYHMQWACRVPYAHLLFGLDAVLALRADRVGHTWTASSWEATGLNCRRFREFRRAAASSGLELLRFVPIPVLGLTLLARLPWLGDLMTFGVDCLARRPPEQVVRAAEAS